MKRIYRRAGIFYARGKNLEQALKFFLEAEEYKKVAYIIEKIGRRLTEQGKSNILCSYIEQLPQPIQLSATNTSPSGARCIASGGQSFMQCGCSQCRQEVGTWIDA